MPELPEVETMRRGIADVAGGVLTGIRSVARALRPIMIEPSLPALRRRAAGQRIVAIDRIGKRVVWRLEQGSSLVFEPRMTGLLLVADPPDRRHLRLRFDISHSRIRHVLFWDQRGLGRVYWLSGNETATRLGPDRIGPDAMHVTHRQLRDRLMSTSRAVKVALLDQSVLAGVGNLYASEILHRARIHPATRCRHLNDPQWRALVTAMRSILTRAIEYEGSTLADGTYRNSLNHYGSYQSQHRVYGKAGELCRTCRDASIRKMIQAQRSTFYCPACQPGARFET